MNFDNATRASIANPPNSAQLGDISYHLKYELHLDLSNSKVKVIGKSSWYRVKNAID